MSKKQTVVVPIDFSSESDNAFQTALEMVEDASHIYLMHVLPVLAATDPGVIWESVNDETRHEHTEKAIRERFSQDKYKDLRIAVAFGDPRMGITAFAKQINAELVVIPSHGRTGLKRLLIGSVTERVCRLAHCPVLVLRK